MHIERRGGPPDLQTAFTQFVLTDLKGRALDDHRNREAPLGKFPDFACFRDLLLIEMKHLESDQSDRINEVFEKMIDPKEQPFFYGTRDGRHITDQVSNGAQINAVLASKLAGTLERQLRKANAQFREYRARTGRKNSVSLCVILNAQLMEFSADLVLRAICGKMKPAADGSLRFPEIDGVLYISEKHATVLPDGRLAFPMPIYTGAPAELHPWKAQIITMIAQRWSRRRTGGDFIPGALDQPFDVIEDVEKQMPRHEMWRLEYKRYPYMRGLSDQQLKITFARCFGAACLSFLNGSWAKPPQKHATQQMRLFTHIIEETNKRGLDLRTVGPRALSAEERAAAYQGLADELVGLLSPKAA